MARTNFDSVEIEENEDDRYVSSWVLNLALSPGKF
jgi:hypothetical protein